MGLYLLFAEDEYNLTDFYERTGHQFQDMIQFCQWKGHKCNASSWSINYTHYGKCYTFNQQGNHKLLKAGKGEGKISVKSTIFATPHA